MESVYYCKECFIDFPTVTRYIKHRKLFCELGRKDVLKDDAPIDGIGKVCFYQIRYIILAMIIDFLLQAGTVSKIIVYIFTKICINVSQNYYYNVF